MNAIRTGPEDCEGKKVFVNVYMCKWCPGVFVTLPNVLLFGNSAKCGRAPLSTLW
jgi:hypothetical protein